MASQEAEKFFDTVSEEGSPAAAASTPTLEEAPMQPTQARFPRPAPDPPNLQQLEEFREAEEIRMATIASLAEAERVSIRPAKAPPSSPKAKAPPPELYEFRCLADEAAPALLPWPRKAPPPPCTRNAEPAAPALLPWPRKSPPPACTRNAEPEADPALPLESSGSAQKPSRAADDGIAGHYQHGARRAVAAPAQQ